MLIWTKTTLADGSVFTPLFIGVASEFRFGVTLTVAALVPVVFVRVVQTVVVTVTNVNTRDAVAVIASE